MKKFILFACSFLCVMMNGNAFAKTYNLRMTSNIFETHYAVINGIKPWMEEIKNSTNGQVKIRYFNPNTICPEGDIFSSTESGIVDIGASNTTRNLNEFPLHDMFSLPMLVDDAVSNGILSWRMYRELPELQKEVDGRFKVLGYQGCGVLRVGTINKPIHTLEDLKGLRIIAINKPIADMVTALGANPIIVPFPDVYMALARNQADGMLFALIAAPSVKTQEFLHHVTEIGLQSELRVFGINRSVWDSFSPEIQKAFEENCMSEEFAARISRPFDDGDEIARDVFRKAGAKFYTLSDEERNRWKEKLTPLHQAWADRMVENGFCSRADADRLLKRLMELSAQVRQERAGK